MFCAHNSVIVNKSTKISKNKCGQVVLYIHNSIRNVSRDQRIDQSAMSIQSLLNTKFSYSKKGT